MGLRAMRGSGRSTFEGKRLILRVCVLIPSAPMYFFCHRSWDLAEEVEDVLYVRNSSTSDRRFLTWDEWFYWSMDVLPAVGGSWLGLDGSMSARVQLAVGGS